MILHIHEKNPFESPVVFILDEVGIARFGDYCHKMIHDRKKILERKYAIVSLDYFDYKLSVVSMFTGFTTFDYEHID
jgi:hypothetical protein